MAVSADKGSYFFPPAPAPDASEWPGSPIGISNTITRTKGRTARSNKSLDLTPELRARLLAVAERKVEECARDGTLFEHDVVVHGVRVRARTNSQHLITFWRDNWYSPEEWSSATGASTPEAPRVMVCAFTGVDDQEEAAYYSREKDTVVFFNTSYYGQLKSWVLGAVGRVLANEYGVHSIHAACVDSDGQGVIYIAPTGTGKSTSSYGLMTTPNTRFHSDDWVYVHYTYRTTDGEPVSPVTITPEGGEAIHGYRCFPWLAEAHPVTATVEALGLDGTRVTLPLQDLDTSSPPEAYAYISEKVFYLRTNLVESFPAAAQQMYSSKLENVPDAGDQFVTSHEVTTREIASAVVGTGASGPSGMDLEQAARMIAFDNSRAMLNISDVFGADTVYLNPMEPVRLDDLFLLKRDFQSDEVLERLSEDRFMERLILGITPDGKREVAYNAYRAVDDRGEREFIDGLGDGDSSLWQRFKTAPGKPQSLEEEFTLFRVLYWAARTYDLNTVLTKDPAVDGKAEAVGLTIRLIAAVVHSDTDAPNLTISDYRSLLTE